MIVYYAVPFLLVAAPPIIVLLSVLIGGCTMTRSTNETAGPVQFQSGPTELRRIIGDTER